MAGELGAGAAGAEMLQEVLRRQFQQAFALKQQRAMEQARQQQQAYQQEQLGLQRRSADRADESARILNEQREAGLASDAAAQATQGHQNRLKASIVGSQNLAGSGDPQGAKATRDALRVALTGSGADAKDIPQEPEPAKPTTKPLIRIGRNGQPTPMGDIPANAQVVNEPAPAGPSHPRFNIVQGADADGKPAMIRTNVDTGQIEVLPIPAGANFVKRDQPATQDQSNLALYANRVEQADPILKQLEGSITKMNPLSFAAQLKADHPSLQSAEVQQYNQAARNFINAVLRRESGAAIAESEFANARGQYLPVPGDSPQVLAQKAENRRIILENYKRSAGPAYKPMSAAGAPAKPGGGDPLGIR